MKHSKNKKKAVETLAKNQEVRALAEKAEEAKMLEAKSIVLLQDPALRGAAKIKIRDTLMHRGKRVVVSGWVHRYRTQSKNMAFIILRDGTGFLQCLMTNKLCQTYDALVLTVESTITIYGMDVFTNKLAADSSPDIKLDSRHLWIRGEEASSVLKVRSVVSRAFRAYFDKRGVCEVTPPLMVQTQLRGRKHSIRAQLLRTEGLFESIVATLPRDLFTCIGRCLHHDGKLPG